MNSFSQNNKDWNEFRWENEIRKDEKRIRHYFQILPSCLDLPDEEDNIISKLMAQPDLVPSKADFAKTEKSLDIFFESDEEQLDIGDLNGRQDADIFLKLHKLSLEWNIIFVKDLRESLRKAGLVTTCTFAKLIARGIDVIEIEEVQIPQFRITLLKRILSGINDLLGQLNSFSSQQVILREKLELLSQDLHNIREKVINILHTTRAK